MRAAVVLLACASPATPPHNAVAPTPIRAVFVVTEMAPGEAYLLACEDGARVVDAKACAPRLAGTTLAVDGHRVDVRFSLGWPCPGPFDVHDPAKLGDQPFVALPGATGPRLVVTAGIEVGTGAGIALWPTESRTHTSGDERSIVSTVELAGQHLLVVRTTELYGLYTPPAATPARASAATSVADHRSANPSRPGAERQDDRGRPQVDAEREADDVDLDALLETDLEPEDRRLELEAGALARHARRRSSRASPCRPTSTAGSRAGHTRAASRSPNVLLFGPG